MNWVEPLLDDYHKWLKNKTITTVDSNSGWIAITTPFIGIYNDLLEIYAYKNDKKIYLSDNGETLNNLELVGSKLRKGERQNVADKILVNYGVTFKEDELWVEATESNFAQKKHNLLSAMIELNDIYMLSKNRVATIFKEDVKAYLDEKEIIYTPDFISKGTTGLDFTFDFQIASRTKEIVIKAFSSLNRLNIPSFLFAWEDIQPVREKLTQKEVKAIAIINDTYREVKSEYTEALNSKQAEIILWSDRYNEDSIIKLRA